ncbi:MFS transporter [Niveibacterium umoris]|uniref:EmrB/QacA subfamily drug resistance transporter n=1 Tax=Niveibacterium umoris TaxID=1193620 RepID=A0A840BPU3_9RHOO|nr:MFS transporter [Niveibacterium umoris]MBB4013489.1 EmrB/QacA subfamily drug resistance transporter [Niveibacterium umoris]
MNNTNPHPHRGTILAIIMASYLMLVVDISIVLTGLPKIRAELAFTPASLSWIQNAYTLAFGGFLLLGARAGDILGRRRMFIVGLAIFTFASLAIGTAMTPAWMIAFRAVQGFGAAVLAPSTLALIATYFEEGQARNRALAWYAAAAGIGATLGLVLGGLLADLISWRAGFFINLPIGAVLIVGSLRYIGETPRHTGRFDLAGALTATLGMFALVFGIVEAAEAGWAASLTQGAILAGILLLGAFLWIEQHASQPLLPLGLLGDAQRNGAYVARLLFLAGMVGFWFFTAQYLQGSLGFSPMQAGLAFVPVTLPQFLSSISVPRVTRRFGQRRVLLAGLSLCVVGLLWLGLTAARMSYPDGVMLPMILLGFGQGWVLAPLTVAGVSGVEGRNAGAASGLVNVAHQLGASLGLAVLVVVYAGGHAPVFDAVGMARHTGITLQAAALLLFAALLVSARYLFRRPPAVLSTPASSQA